MGAQESGGYPTKVGKVDYSWLRMANDEEERAARREVSLITERAIECRGYIMGPNKVDLVHVERMLAGTQMIAPTKGNWPKEEAEESKEEAQVSKEEAPQVPADDAEVPAEEPPSKVQIRIQKGIVFEEATKVAREGGKNVVAVNAASSYHTGGGFKTGGRHALEEAMCVQSTLYPSLLSAARLAEQANVVAPDWVRPAQKVSGASWLQHIPDDGVVLSPYVEIFRGGTNDGYPFEEAAVMLEGVVSVAMPNCNQRMSDSPVDAHPDPDEYKAQLRRKWRAVFTAASRYTQADTLVVPDAGCGVFRNPPDQVGIAFGEVLREEFSGCFKEVIITYPGGRNGDTFAEFAQATFEGREPQTQGSEHDATAANAAAALLEHALSGGMGTVRGQKN